MTSVINSKFGNLQSDSDFTYWSGDLKLDNQNLRVTAEFEDARQVPETLPEKFESFFISLSQNDASIRQAAAEKLLRLYNETWSVGETITAEEFAAKIKLDGVSFREGEDMVEIYYDDADLFAGHQIVVVTDYDGQVEKADL